MSHDRTFSTGPVSHPLSTRAPMSVRKFAALIKDTNHRDPTAIIESKTDSLSASKELLTHTSQTPLSGCGSPAYGSENLLGGASVHSSSQTKSTFQTDKFVKMVEYLVADAESDVPLLPSNSIPSRRLSCNGAVPDRRSSLNAPNKTKGVAHASNQVSLVTNIKIGLDRKGNTTTTAPSAGVSTSVTISSHLPSPTPSSDKNVPTSHPSSDGPQVAGHSATPSATARTLSALERMKASEGEKLAMSRGVKPYNAHSLLTPRSISAPTTLAGSMTSIKNLEASPRTLSFTSPARPALETAMAMTLSAVKRPVLLPHQTHPFTTTTTTTTNTSTTTNTNSASTPSRTVSAPVRTPSRGLAASTLLMAVKAALGDTPGTGSAAGGKRALDMLEMLELKEGRTSSLWNNAEFHVLHAQALEQIGESPRALRVYDAALEDPSVQPQALLKHARHTFLLRFLGSTGMTGKDNGLNESELIDHLNSSAEEGVLRDLETPFSTDDVDPTVTFHQNLELAAKSLSSTIIHSNENTKASADSSSLTLSSLPQRISITERSIPLSSTTCSSSSSIPASASATSFTPSTFSTSYQQYTQNTSRLAEELLLSVKKGSRSKLSQLDVCSQTPVAQSLRVLLQGALESDNETDGHESTPAKGVGTNVGDDESDSCEGDLNASLAWANHDEGDDVGQEQRRQSLHVDTSMSMSSLSTDTTPSNESSSTSRKPRGQGRKSSASICNVSKASITTTTTDVYHLVFEPTEDIARTGMPDSSTPRLDEIGPRRRSRSNAFKDNAPLPNKRRRTMSSTMSSWREGDESDHDSDVNRVGDKNGEGNPALPGIDVALARETSSILRRTTSRQQSQFVDDNDRIDGSGTEELEGSPRSHVNQDIDDSGTVTPTLVMESYVPLPTCEGPTAAYSSSSSEKGGMGTLILTSASPVDSSNLSQSSASHYSEGQCVAFDDSPASYPNSRDHPSSLSASSTPTTSSPSYSPRGYTTPSRHAPNQKDASFDYVAALPDLPQANVPISPCPFDTSFTDNLDLSRVSLPSSDTPSRRLTNQRRRSSLLQVPGTDNDLDISLVDMDELEAEQAARHARIEALHGQHHSDQTDGDDRYSKDGANLTPRRSSRLARSTTMDIQATSPSSLKGRKRKPSPNALPCTPSKEPFSLPRPVHVAAAYTDTMTGASATSQSIPSLSSDGQLAGSLVVLDRIAPSPSHTQLCGTDHVISPVRRSARTLMRSLTLTPNNSLNSESSALHQLQPSISKATTSTSLSSVRQGTPAIIKTRSRSAHLASSQFDVESASHQPESTPQVPTASLSELLTTYQAAYRPNPALGEGGILGPTEVAALGPALVLTTAVKDPSTGLNQPVNNDRQRKQAKRTLNHQLTPIVRRSTRRSMTSGTVVDTVTTAPPERANGGRRTEKDKVHEVKSRRATPARQTKQSRLVTDPTERKDEKECDRAASVNDHEGTHDISCIGMQFANEPLYALLPGATLDDEYAFSTFSPSSTNPQRTNSSARRQSSRPRPSSASFSASVPLQPAATDDTSSLADPLELLRRRGIVLAPGQTVDADGFVVPAPKPRRRRASSGSIKRRRSGSHSPLREEKDQTSSTFLKTSLDHLTEGIPPYSSSPSSYSASPEASCATGIVTVTAAAAAAGDGDDSDDLTNALNTSLEVPSQSEFERALANEDVLTTSSPLHAHKRRRSSSRFIPLSPIEVMELSSPSPLPSQTLASKGVLPKAFLISGDDAILGNADRAATSTPPKKRRRLSSELAEAAIESNVSSTAVTQVGSLSPLDTSATLIIPPVTSDMTTGAPLTRERRSVPDVPIFLPSRPRSTRRQPTHKESTENSDSSAQLQSPARTLRSRPMTATLTRTITTGTSATAIRAPTPQVRAPTPRPTKVASRIVPVPSISSQTPTTSRPRSAATNPLGSPRLKKK